MVTFSSVAEGKVTVLKPLTKTVVEAPLTTLMLSPALVPLTVTVSTPPTASIVKVVATPVKLRMGSGGGGKTGGGGGVGAGVGAEGGGRTAIAWNFLGLEVEGVARVGPIDDQRTAPAVGGWNENRAENALERYRNKCKGIVGHI